MGIAALHQWKQITAPLVFVMKLVLYTILLQLLHLEKSVQPKVSVLGVVTFWDDCMNIPTDQGVL